jgi:hypothetical protein
MKILQTEGYPPALLASMLQKSREPHEDERRLSCTQLIDSPRLRLLYRQHYAEIEQTADELLWAFFGTIGHSVLEGATVDGTTEVDLSAQIGGWTLSGRSDLIDNDGILWDYKTTSVYATKDGIKPAWVEQLNIYAWLFKGVASITGLRIVAIHRDWTQREKRKCAAWYPKPVTTYEVPLWPLHQTEAFIREKLLLHEAAVAAQKAGKRLPLCTPAETWDGKRCASYCPCRAFCDQRNGGKS